MVMVTGGNMDLNIRPIYCGHMTASDCNLPARKCPDNVITGDECKKNSGENRAPVDLSFMDSCMDLLCVVPFQANLDFLAEKFLASVNDQCSDILSDIQHCMFGMNPLAVLLNHPFLSYLPSFYHRSTISFLSHDR